MLFWSFYLRTNWSWSRKKLWLALASMFLSYHSFPGDWDGPGMRVTDGYGPSESDPELLVLLMEMLCELLEGPLASVS
jgi:hypothetical protein